MRRLQLALTLALLLPRAGAAQTQLIDRIVLRINDRVLTLMDFERVLGDKRQGILSDTSLDDSRRRQALAEAGKATLGDLYEELLLLSRSDQMGAKVSEGDIDKAMAQMRDRMGLKSDQQYTQALVSSGMTEAALRERMRKNLLVQEVMGREVQPRLKVSEEELRRYYRAHPEAFTEAAALKLQDLVVLEEGRDPQAVQHAARQAYDALSNGGAFEQIAKKGAAAGTTTDVVELGWVQRGDLDADLDQAAWKLKPGQVTVPVAGRGGLHIVRLVERREPRLRPFDDVKEQIQSQIEQQHMGKEYRAYLRELEQRSYIALKVPPEAEGFKPLATGGDEAPQEEGLGGASPVRADAAAASAGSAGSARTTAPPARRAPSTPPGPGPKTPTAVPSPTPPPPPG